MLFDRVEEIRRDFPILSRRSTTSPWPTWIMAQAARNRRQCSRPWIDYYRRHNANVHRGVHTLSEEATAQFENARLRVARFINSPTDKQVIFTSGTTEGVNLVANSWGRANLGPGDEVLITEMEHHSNIVPWQILRDQLGFTLRYIPITLDGKLDLSDLDSSGDGTDQTA